MTKITVAEAVKKAREENPEMKMTVHEAVRMTLEGQEGVEQQEEKRYYKEVGVWDFFNNEQRMYCDIKSFTEETVENGRTTTLIGRNGDKFFVKGHVNNYKEVSE